MQQSNSSPGFTPLHADEHNSLLGYRSDAQAAELYDEAMQRQCAVPERCQTLERVVQPAVVEDMHFTGQRQRPADIDQGAGQAPGQPWWALEDQPREERSPREHHAPRRRPRRPTGCRSFTRSPRPSLCCKIVG